MSAVIFVTHDGQRKTAVSRGPADPICPRVSIGGPVNGSEYYCVIRGDLDRCIQAAETALAAIRAARDTKTELQVDRRFRELGGS